MSTNPSTTDTPPSDESTTRRGLFRRSRRSVDDAATSDATVDEAHDDDSQVSADDAPVQRPNFNLAAAAEARQIDDVAQANAAAQTPVTSPTPETPVHTSISDSSDIEARLDAVLSPTTMPASVVNADDVVAQATEQIRHARQQAAAASAPMQVVMPSSEPSQPAMMQPTVAAQPVAAPAAAAPPSTIEVSAAPTATRLLGLDVQRMVTLLEDEAQAAQQRIDLELRNAQARAEEIVVAAQHDAERIREHGQNQARVLLGEVEEIISEAQQTGEQILRRADAESGQLRQQAGVVLSQAQTEARSMIDAARREGEQVLAEQRRLATARAQEALREQERLKDQIRRLEERRRQVLESLEPLIDQLSQMMPAVDMRAQQTAPHQRNVVSIDRSRSINAGG